MEVIRLYVMATCVFSVTNAQVSDDCKNPLGMEDGSIQASQLTSSSVWNNNDDYDATEGRLDGQSCWIARTLNQHQWIQVVFATPTYVSGIILQGTAYGENEWVTWYKVQYYFGSSWQFVKGDNQNDKVFRGNSDRNSHVTSLFTSEVRVTHIRIRPTAWNKHISLRFEILGCEDINECASNPCVNGECKDGVNRYTCTCGDGWSGRICNQNINECVGSPCVNGECQDGVNQYTCICGDGWTGRICNQNINECASNPCVNGECQDGVNRYTCICGDGWTGGICNQNINECASNPCLNGECRDGVNRYTCTCGDGWTGSVCDQNINDCVNSSPCVNGECQDGISRYTCTCNAGWTGSVCDQMIDECVSSPCVNGECQDQLNSFTCICQQGYNETLCDNDINDCDSNPCMNGQCEDGVNRFTCYCDNGWDGIHCDQCYHRPDGRCGPQYRGPQGEDSICLADNPCCSTEWYCGNTRTHCVTQLYRDFSKTEITVTLKEPATDSLISEQLTSPKLSSLGALMPNTMLSTPDYTSKSESSGNQNTSGSAPAIAVAIPLVLLIIIVGCVVIVILKRRKIQQVGSKSETVIQSDGPYGDTATNVITSSPTKDTHTYAGVEYPNVDVNTVAIPSEDNGELYQDVLDKPSEVKQQDTDEIYQDIQEDSKTNPPTKDDDIYTDIHVQDNKYAYAHTDTELVKAPSVDGELVYIYAKSQYGGVPCPAENGSQQKGWAKNDIYAKSDEDQLPKHQNFEENKEEGWVENDIYAKSGEEQPKRQGGEIKQVKGWVDNSIYDTKGQ